MCACGGQMTDGDSRRVFLVRSADEFAAVEAHILRLLGCVEGRCTFMRTDDFVKLRRQAIYGVRCPGLASGAPAVACASNGLFVYTLEDDAVAVGWGPPDLVRGLAC